jgi:hypothetical protein
MLGILYDVHGNLTALEAVLADAEDVDEWLLGGDYCTSGPGRSRRLRGCASCRTRPGLRGNGERWLVDPPLNLPAEQSEMVFAALASAIAELPAAEVDTLVGLPTLAEREDAFYCHGSPLSDIDSFPPEPGDDDVRLLAGVKERQVVFGHSHIQFRRPGPNDTDLANPVASACRSTATRGPLGRSDATTASWSFGTPRMTSDPPSRRCVGTTGASRSPSGC